jgi:receptor protein-tyrosine kinase
LGFRKTRGDTGALENHAPLFDRSKLVLIKSEDEPDPRTRIERSFPFLGRLRNARSTASQQAEQQVTNLVDRVFLFKNSSAPRIVTFAGVDKSEASSELCLRAAGILARRTSRAVCLLDASTGQESAYQIRSANSIAPLQHRDSRLGLPNNSAIQDEGGEIWLFPHAMLERTLDDFRVLLAELQSEFDYVLIAAPPVSDSAPAVLLAQMSDGLIMTIEANSTSRETALRAKETLDSARVAVLGAILNHS